LSKGLKTTIVILTAMVALGLLTLPGLRQAVQRLQTIPRTEEQARREVMQEPISTPTDVQVQAQIYWLSAASPNSLEPTTIQLPLSADPVERSKQLLNALIARAPSAEKRTLPAEAILLAFYLQPDGTAIADFSDEIASGMPSGILSEQLAVQSITQTLGANVNGIRQLKILIHGRRRKRLRDILICTGCSLSPLSGQRFRTAERSNSPTASTPSPAKNPASKNAPQPKTPAATPPKQAGPAPGKNSAQ